jgi:hypothetical protein
MAQHSSDQAELNVRFREARMSGVHLRTHHKVGWAKSFAGFIAFGSLKPSRLAPSSPLAGPQAPQATMPI